MKISTKWWPILLVIFACTLAAAATSAQEIRGGDALLRAMHDRYQSNWYDTVTFTQKSTTHNSDGIDKSEIWREAAILPGKLRIDIGPPADGNVMLVADGTLSVMRAGKITVARPLVHMLLVLGFDVYKQDPKITIDQAAGQGFDLTKMREGVWEGEPVYVVGAAKDDLQSKQFWIEKKRLLFVRMIEPDERDKTKISDIRFADYRQLTPGWIAARVEFYSNGKNVFTETYSDIVANPKVDPSDFDAKHFGPRPAEK
ncbi:MAG TPA: hypothetical protein VGI16_01335 [Candidatus Acidoferrum sp.]|jgi:outer membrane lipoprotein-sorting protein